MTRLLTLGALVLVAYVLAGKWYARTRPPKERAQNALKAMEKAGRR